MKLDRSLIKSQSKQLIKGKVFELFLVSAVVFAITGAVGSVVQFSYGMSDISLGTFFNALETGSFDNFFGSEPASIGLPFVSNLGSLVSLLTAPLFVTLMTVFIQLIRGNNAEIGNSFKITFAGTFNDSYGRKLLLCVLERLLIVLGFVFFIIPGIVLYYRFYFADMIMADYPKLSAKQALNISKKMTAGHKGELFMLDLSFIGWGFVCAITFGLASIYVIPYALSTRALYYENFRIRCFQENILTGEDFMVNGNPYPQ